jgi:heme/copper-type cytochrome/quinol oxidase subunit 2
MVAPVFARRSVGALAAVTLAGAVLTGAGDAVPAARTPFETMITAPQETAPARREFTLTGRRYAFSPDRIEVTQDDLVKITLVAEDIPHSFTIDAYRIAKRAAPGRPVTFEFRADRPGTFEFYCNLTTDEGCRRMRGELVVAARPR